jgi:hypothetical protein
VGIAVNLIFTGRHVVLRDIVVAIGAFVLARLTVIRNRGGC